MHPTFRRQETHAKTVTVHLLTDDAGLFFRARIRGLGWRRRFEAAWPDIAALGFDDRFRRMWLYYLTYCEVGFERGQERLAVSKENINWALDADA